MMTFCCCHTSYHGIHCRRFKNFGGQLAFFLVNLEVLLPFLC